jgi:hypothetical protein
MRADDAVVPYYDGRHEALGLAAQVIVGQDGRGLAIVREP